MVRGLSATLFLFVRDLRLENMDNILEKFLGTRKWVFLRTLRFRNFKNKRSLNKTTWLKIKLYKCYNFQKDGQAKDMGILTIT